MNSTLVAVAAAVVVLTIALFAVVAFRRRSAVMENDFKKVFMTTSKEGQEALIKRWTDRKRCSRREAMRLAVEEWRREQRSWR